MECLGGLITASNRDRKPRLVPSIRVEDELTWAVMKAVSSERGAFGYRFKHSFEGRLDFGLRVGVWDTNDEARSFGSL